MYIIVGGSGFFGHYIVRKILENANDSIIATYTQNAPSLLTPRLKWMKLDVCNDNDIRELNNICDSNSKVIYLSAYSSPDFCEKNKVKAWDLNVTGVSNFINKFEKAKCLYFASTDVVYGEGSLNQKFNEKSPTNPSNTYGLHKKLSEQLVLAKGYNVFRLPLMMGKSLVEGKKHFYDVIIEKLKTNEEIEMYIDSSRTTLHFSQCAELLIQLIEKYESCDQKIVNIAADSLLSKYDLGIYIAKELGYDCKLIKPISITENDTIFSAKRAATTYMDNALLKKLLNKTSIEFKIKKERAEYVN